MNDVTAYICLPILAAVAAAPLLEAEEYPMPHIDALPQEAVVAPVDMAGRLRLLRETMALADMLRDVAEDPGIYAAPAATVRLVVDKFLLPRWQVLTQHPATELRELCLLADAIDWQGDWLLDMAEGDSCVALARDAESLTCLERLQKAAQAVARRLERGAEPQLAAELRRGLALLGGEQVLQLPAQLLEQRWAKDYKTAYAFFCEFKAALAQEDAAAMSALADYTDYLLQGEADVLRLNALAAVYARVCRAEYRVRRPRWSISSEMQAAMQPFLQRLPALRGVLP